MADDRIRVLVVDDTVTYRKIVSDVLSGVPEIEVVGTATNGKIALRKIEQLHPDLLTLDMEMPEMDGLEVLRRLRDAGSDVGAIILSGSTKEGAESTMTALSLGAFDFVAKPVGSSPQQNADELRNTLCPKIKAYARARHVHNLLRGRKRLAPATTAAPPAAPPQKPSEVAGRMKRIVGGATGNPQVVALGISTGGPQALTRMLPQLPQDLPVPVLIVQHMPPVFTKSLADDLDKRCSLSVCEASEGRIVRAGRILIAPGGKQMKVEREGNLAVIRITDDPPENSCRPAVDYLFRSVAEVYGPDTVGVIMTGMGNDGSRGCRLMKQQGAAILVQDEATCVVFGMPREPIEQGIADVVAPLDQIAAEIVRLTGKRVAACR